MGFAKPDPCREIFSVVLLAAEVDRLAVLRLGLEQYGLGLAFAILRTEVDWRIAVQADAQGIGIDRGVGVAVFGGTSSRQQQGGDQGQGDAHGGLQRRGRM